MPRYVRGTAAGVRFRRLCHANSSAAAALSVVPGRGRHTPMVATRRLSAAVGDTACRYPGAWLSPLPFVPLTDRLSGSRPRCPRMRPMRLCSVSSGRLAARWRICDSGNYRSWSTRPHWWVSRSTSWDRNPAGLSRRRLGRRREVVPRNSWGGDHSKPTAGVLERDRRGWLKPASIAAALADSSPVLCLRCDHPELAEFLSFFIRLFGAPLPTLGRTVFGRSHDLAAN